MPSRLSPGARPAAQDVGVGTGGGERRACPSAPVGLTSAFLPGPPMPVPVGSLFMALGQSLDSESLTVCGHLKSCLEMKSCGVWEVRGVIIKQ